MRLYHYTCAHSALGIERDRVLRGNPHPYLPNAGPLIHLTDLEQPDRLGLGLTSLTLRCDRTEYRITVDTDKAQHWPRYARTMDRATRELFEGTPGARPMHWHVATGPISILAIEPVAVSVR